jgi:hypothetical protein
MALSPPKRNPWYCAGCGAKLPNSLNDEYCLACLPSLYGSLARELWSNGGMAFGRPLAAVFAKPRRQSRPSWLHRVDKEADAGEGESGEAV